MVDYKTFKKEYLNEWVDKSQAARKAAEELANKEVKPSLRDKYLPVGRPDHIFQLCGKSIEFKTINEVNQGGVSSKNFPWNLAMERFEEPDEDGWRLPTKEELSGLIEHYPYLYDSDFKEAVFDERLELPDEGWIYYGGNTPFPTNGGSYWTSTICTSKANSAYMLSFRPGVVHLMDYSTKVEASVRLVREVK